MTNTAWTEIGAERTIWLRNSGIDTSVPTYDDPTISYNDPLEFYDGYDATTVTEDDVKFTAWTDIT